MVSSHMAQLSMSHWTWFVHMQSDETEWYIQLNIIAINLPAKCVCKVLAKTKIPPGGICIEKITLYFINTHWQSTAFSWYWLNIFCSASYLRPSALGAAFPKLTKQLSSRWDNHESTNNLPNFQNTGISGASSWRIEESHARAIHYVCIYELWNKAWLIKLGKKLLKRALLILYHIIEIEIKVSVTPDRQTGAL